MRVLIVDEEMIAGGVETLQRRLVPALAKLVDRIVWVLPGHAADYFRDVEKRCENVIIETLNSPGGIARVREGLARRAGGVSREFVDGRLRRLALKHGCGICMTTCVFGQEIPGVGLPVAGFVSDINPALPTGTLDNIGRWVERADATFAVSDFTCTELKRMKPGRSEWIHSIPLAPTAAKARGGVIKGSFLYPAAPNRHKGHLVLLQAARGLSLRGMDYRLTLTGAGMDAFARPGGENEVISEMQVFFVENKELMDGRVVVAGDAGPSEIERLFVEASCVVLPSSYEGFGLPLSEALGHGKDVICSDIAPFREQVERHDCARLATFVSPGNAAALEAAMAAHLGGGKSAHLTEKELRERLDRWTWEDAARRCVTLLEGIANHG